MFKKFFSYYLLLLFLLFILLYFTIIYNYNSISTSNKNTKPNYYFSNSNFTWPVPGNYTITSPFGPRKSPTSGASFNHSGIDIAATQNTNIYAVLGGIVTWVRI